MPFSDLSSDNDSIDGPPPNASTLLSSPPGPAMPASLTSAASLVQPGEGNEWRVRAGEDLPSFLFANGPGSITRYNLHTVHEHTWSDRVIRHVRGAKPGYSDIFELTPDGRRMHGTLLGWQLELACTGESMYSKAPPNCQRTCCQGFGECEVVCCHRGRHTGCSVRVVVQATLADVAAGCVTVTLSGQHVPSAMQMVPPPHNGLKPMPAALAKLRGECVAGKLPTVAVNDAIASLGEGAERNTRLAPPARVVAGLKKRAKRKQRGGSMDDATRIDQLVRRHLIQRGCVLLYQPGVQLVLTTRWALERARTDGRAFITTDAKVDTVKGIRSKWTSVRCKTERGLSAPVGVWIAPDETNERIQHGIMALRRNMRCTSPTCSHTLTEVHRPDGSYERWLSCDLWWEPAVCIDKHLPSFNGLMAAGLGRLFLCDWHGYKCFDSRLVELNILGDAADQINWAFRLLKRARTDAQSFDLRDAIAIFLVRQAALPGRLWTLELAEQLMDYIDKCWMYPAMIRLAWIDALGLLTDGYINTTGELLPPYPGITTHPWNQSLVFMVAGISEASHAYWSKMMMRSVSNRLVSETVVKTVGITADGELTTGFFRDAETRWSDAEGRPLDGTPDRNVRHAKACLAFLTLGPKCIYPHPMTVLTIDDFKSSALIEPDGEEHGRGWHRHRRESGARLSSDFRAPELRPPNDAELAALVLGLCQAHQQRMPGLSRTPRPGEPSATDLFADASDDVPATPPNVSVNPSIDDADPPSLPPLPSVEPGSDDEDADIQPVDAEPRTPDLISSRLRSRTQATAATPSRATLEAMGVPAENVPPGDPRPDVSVDGFFQALEDELGDLSSRDDCIATAIEVFCRNVRASEAGCLLVPHLPSDAIRRHAEAATTRRTARGLAPQFPSGLRPVLELLAHGGKLSFSEPELVSVDVETGRCECMDSTYHGVLSAVLTGERNDHRGACKHHQLGRLCQKAFQSAEAEAAVRDDCADFLCTYIQNREASKPKESRCNPLYTAAKAADIEALLEALKTHPSLPPTGKGVAATAEPEAESSRATASDGEEADDDEALEAAVEELQSLPRRSCSFSAAELATNGFRVAFTQNSDSGGGVGLVVAAWLSVEGPSVSSGEQIQPGDVVLTMNDADASGMLSAEGKLDVPAGKPVTLEYVRHERCLTPYLGGRPAAVKPKYGRNAVRKGKGKQTAWASHVRDAELLGGAPAQAARKPQRSRAREHAARSVDDPSADEQMEAVLREAAEVGGGEQEIARIVEETERRLLARRELGPAEKEARDVELREAVYSQ